MEPWLPQGFDFKNNLKIRRIIFDGFYYQIYTMTGAESSVLVVKKDFAEQWIGEGLINPEALRLLLFGSEEYRYVTTDKRLLVPISKCDSPTDVGEATSFAIALRKTREASAKGLSEAIYLEKYSLLLPIPSF